MFQSNIDEYTALIGKNLSEYMVQIPSPFVDIETAIKGATGDFAPFSLEMFDIAAITALIRSHKDAKDTYEVNCFLVEILTSMFRVAIHKLNWLSDTQARDITDMLAYDTDNEKGREAFKFFLHSVCQFPYDYTNQKWYAFLMPLLAYTKQHKFNRSNYFSRYMVNIINKYSIELNRGEHFRDVNVDQLKCTSTLRDILRLCAKDTTKSSIEEKYWLYRNITVEFARVYLGCLLQRSASKESFGKIGAEVVAQHYMSYQTICQEYLTQRQAKEQLK